MAFDTAMTPRKALSSLPDTILRTVFDQGKVLWSLFDQNSKVRLADAAQVHVPPSVRSPLPHQQGADDVPGTTEAEINVWFKNMPRGARVRSRASGAALQIDTGRSVRTDVNRARSGAGFSDDPVSDAAGPVLAGGMPDSDGGQPELCGQNGYSNQATADPKKLRELDRKPNAPDARHDGGCSNQAATDPERLRALDRNPIVPAARRDGGYSNEVTADPEKLRALDRNPIAPAARRDGGYSNEITADPKKLRALDRNPIAPAVRRDGVYSNEITADPERLRALDRNPIAPDKRRDRGYSNEVTSDPEQVKKLDRNPNAPDARRGKDYSNQATTDPEKLKELDRNPNAPNARQYKGYSVGVTDDPEKLRELDRSPIAPDTRRYKGYSNEATSDPEKLKELDRNPDAPDTPRDKDFSKEVTTDPQERKKLDRNPNAPDTDLLLPGVKGVGEFKKVMGGPVPRMTDDALHDINIYEMLERRYGATWDDLQTMRGLAFSTVVLKLELVLVAGVVGFVFAAELGVAAWALEAYEAVDHVHFAVDLLDFTENLYEEYRSILYDDLKWRMDMMQFDIDRDPVRLRGTIDEPPPPKLRGPYDR